MGLGNLLLLTQTGGYSVSTILSLCCIVPLILNLQNFKGKCILNSSGKFLETNGFFEPAWASFSYCFYTLLVGIILFAVSVIQLVRMSLFLYKGLDSSFLSAFWDAVVSFILVLLTLISAIIITSGFSCWCSAVTQKFASCETAIVMTFSENDKDIVPTNFFIEMVTIQIGTWSCFVIWVLLFVLACRKLIMYHERENIIISMSRERRRYMANDFQS